MFFPKFAPGFHTHQPNPTMGLKGRSCAGWVEKFKRLVLAFMTYTVDMQLKKTVSLMRKK